MKWNWERSFWPRFTYEAKELERFEKEFLHGSGVVFGVYQHLGEKKREGVKVEVIAREAFKTSEIEGEVLDRDSLQSSIRRNFGLKTDHRKIAPSEKGIADVMTDLYRNFSNRLTHKKLFEWHKMLMNGRRDLLDVGKYRRHDDPMQIVSGRLDEPKIHFEAPPSKRVKQEMDDFIRWFNESAESLPALARAGIAHLYFVSIHPFEDGNGRIARALSIKALSQSIGQPLLTSLSTIIQSKRKAYYDALEANNKNGVITDWLIYFAKTFLESQERTKALIEFVLQKSKLYERLRDQLNERQRKVLDRMFREGLDGFEGGLSAENYIAITKTSRPTATRDLQDLAEKKALLRKGELKGTRYWLNLSESDS